MPKWRLLKTDELCLNKKNVSCFDEAKLFKYVQTFLYESANCFLISLVKHFKMTLYETLNKTLNLFFRGNYTSTTTTIESSHIFQLRSLWVRRIYGWAKGVWNRTDSVSWVHREKSMKSTDSKCCGHFFNTRFYISSLYVTTSRFSAACNRTPWCSPFYRRARWNISSRMFLAECLQSCNTGSSHWKGECVVFCRRNLLLLTKLPSEDIIWTQII